MVLPAAELKLVRRITNGLTPEEIASVTAYGYNGYIDMQLNPSAIDDSACDTRLAPYTTIGLPTPQLYALDSNTVQTHVIESTILRAIYSKRQLFERMVEFWTDHFNTDINTVGILKTADVRDVLRGNALGTFPQMLNAQATSPAMINRLNNQQNSRTAPNQNYAREVMELHTLGVDRRLHAAGHRRSRPVLHRLALQQHDQRSEARDVRVQPERPRHGHEAGARQHHHQRRRERRAHRPEDPRGPSVDAPVRRRRSCCAGSSTTSRPRR